MFACIHIKGLWHQSRIVEESEQQKVLLMKFLQEALERHYVVFGVPFNKSGKLVFIY